MKRLNSVKMIWVRSFILLITILMVILISFFIIMRFMIQQEEMERSASENQFLKTVLDEKFMSVTDLATGLMYRPAQLFPDMEGDAPYTGSEVYRLVAELESRCSSNKVIEDIFIYYPDRDFIIGANGPRLPQTYYYFYNDRSQAGFEHWNQNLLNQELQGYFFFDSEGGERDLLYGRHISLDNGLSCNIYFKINRQHVVTILEEANDSHTNQFSGIMDFQNRVYAGSGDASLIACTSDLNHEETVAAMTVGNYFIGNQSSYASPVYYLTIKNKSSVLKLSGHMVWILFGCVFLCIIASVPTVFYLSNKNSKPVQQLMNKLSVASTGIVGNEYDVIGQNLDQLMLDYNQAVSQLERQQQLLNRAFVSLAVSGEARDLKTLSLLAGVYGIEFPYPGFCVVITDIPDAAENRYWEKLPMEGKMLFACHGIAEERLVSLLNFDSEDGVDTVTQFVLDLEQRIEEAALPHRIAVGGVYQTLSGIRFSYSEAVYVLDTSKEKLLHYKDSKHKIGEKDNSTAFYEFQRCLLERDYNGAERCLPLLFKEYLTNANPVVYKYRKSSVFQHVYEAIQRETSGIGAAKLMEQQYTERLFSKGTPEQTQENIRLILEQLAAIIVNASEDDSSLAGKAKKLISSSWSDPMLGLAALADQLKVSEAHLSRVFKREVGVGVAEYISRLRVEASKKLIESGEMNIKSIALSVGFTSDTNFIRVFKKYENTTPGKYEVSRETPPDIKN